jgi:hypothetical protein
MVSFVSSSFSHMVDWFFCLASLNSKFAITMMRLSTLFILPHAAVEFVSTFSRKETLAHMAAVRSHSESTLQMQTIRTATLRTLVRCLRSRKRPSVTPTMRSVTLNYNSPRAQARTTRAWFWVHSFLSMLCISKGRSKRWLSLQQVLSS